MRWRPDLVSERRLIERTAQPRVPAPQQQGHGPDAEDAAANAVCQGKRLWVTE